MRDTKSRKSKLEDKRFDKQQKKAEQDNPALLLVFSLLSFSHLDYSNPASAFKLFDTRLPESRICS
ncbi:hypothetical protein BCU85_06055 [Vibrio lentus]|nr:hypothetical protein BCU85_06055 [Vibrio lentus]PMK90271.1 hypothetical protein BCT88_19870 [Vibrio lentus]PML20406.1 hypothetical protein BCT80_18735 [Vibrio lentus]PMM25336.1 hypothetical protein BCT57_22390 [Vibrio lentus]PMM51878.1 hypothetical protein BCT53_00875 [Vibrio lentus]